MSGKPNRGNAFVGTSAPASGMARAMAAMQRRLSGRPSRDTSPSTTAVPVPRPPAEEGIRFRLGFTVDVVGFTARTIDTQHEIQTRLYAILRRLVAETGTELLPANFQSTGDGYHYFLPDTDLHTAMRHLLITLPGLLAKDNRDHDERIRLRMATDVGTVGSGPLGLTADAVVSIARMVVSEPIREAARRHDADFVALVSQTLYENVVVRFSDLAALPCRPVEVAVKNYRAHAHLFVRPESPPER